MLDDRNMIQSGNSAEKTRRDATSSPKTTQQKAKDWSTRAPIE